MRPLTRTTRAIWFAVAAVVISISAAPLAVASCVRSRVDDFNNGLLGPYLTASPACGSVAIQSGQIVLFEDGCSEGPSATMHGTGRRLCGDFDVSVDFELVSFGVPPSGTSRWAGLYLYTVQGVRYAAAQRYNQNWGSPCYASENYHFYITDPDTCATPTNAIVGLGFNEGDSGKLRIQRTGTTLSFYYWDGGWELAMTGTASTADLELSLSAASDTPAGSQDARFDNLTVTTTQPPVPGSYPQQWLAAAALLGLFSLSRIHRGFRLST